MKKYISLLLALAFCFLTSVTALAETVVISPEDISDGSVKTFSITRGGSFGMWFLVIVVAIIAVFALIIIINKKRDSKKNKDL